MDIEILLINYKKGLNWLEKNYPIEFSYIQNYIGEQLLWKEKFYLYINGISDIPKCKTCNNKTKFINLTKGFRNYCSTKCLSNSVEIKEKRKETSIQKWGCDNPMQNNDVLNKLQQSILTKYGTDNISKLKETKEKVKQTNKEKYGFEFNSQRPEVKNTLSKKISDNNRIKEIHKINRVLNIKEKIKEYDIKFINEKSSIYTLLCEKCMKEFLISKTNVNDRIKNLNTICTNCNPINNSSDFVNQMSDYIKSIYSGDIIKNSRKIIDGEIDIYLPILKIGFEFNGIFWHSEKYRDRNYHIEKTLKCSDKGIRLFHIWEDDWKFKNDIIKSQLENWLGKTENKIWARKCVIKEMTSIQDKKISKSFLDENHIQGSDKSTLRIGLYYNNSLVSLMCFDQFEGRKKMKIDEWNLSRFCNLKKTTIVGGASKLLSYFIEKYKPLRVISYASRDWSIGKLYENLGFNLLYITNPDYKYIVNGRRIHKSRFRKSLLPTNLSESEYMLSKNIYKIWDCGKIKYEKTNF